MITNIDFLNEHYHEQIEALNSFIKDAYPYLPNQDNSLNLLRYRTLFAKS